MSHTRVFPNVAKMQIPYIAGRAPSLIRKEKRESDFQVKYFIFEP
jgi:hypothetical protein